MKTVHRRIRTIKYTLCAFEKKYFAKPNKQRPPNPFGMQKFGDHLQGLDKTVTRRATRVIFMLGCFYFVSRERMFFHSVLIVLTFLSANVFTCMQLDISTPAGVGFWGRRVWVECCVCRAKSKYSPFKRVTSASTVGNATFHTISRSFCCCCILCSVLIELKESTSSARRLQSH